MKKLLFVMIAGLLAMASISGCDDSDAPDPITSPYTALVHVDLIPMTSEMILPDQTVLVEGDRIVAIGDTDEVEIPRGALVIDGGDAYLMPGLADMHVHIYEESRDVYPVSPFKLYIAKGVTTIRDCGTAPLGPSDTFVLNWRDEILSGKIAGPMLYSAGRTIHGPVANPDRIVQERQANGFDFVKLYMELSVDEFSEAQATAEELGIFTVGHIPYQVGLDQAISAGLDEIAHVEELSFELMWAEHRPSRRLSMDEWLGAMVSTVFDTYGLEEGADLTFDPAEFTQSQGDRFEEILLELKKHDIPVGTTLAVYEVVDQKIFAEEAFLARPESIYLPAELIEAILAGEDRHQLIMQALGENKAAWHWKRDLDTYILQQLHHAGVMLVSGTDAGSSTIGVVEGFATHDDLRLLTEHGFTPYEALQTATVNAAYTVEKMTGTNDFGTIEMGKRADFILVSDNPLVDIQNTQKILGVMARGKWYPKAKLEEMITIDGGKNDV